MPAVVTKVMNEAVTDGPPPGEETEVIQATATVATV